MFGPGGVILHRRSLAWDRRGRLILVDGDTVSDSNRNRQLIALRFTVGQPKAEVMGPPVRDINPPAGRRLTPCFICPGGTGPHRRLRFCGRRRGYMAAKRLSPRSAGIKGIPLVSAIRGNKLESQPFPGGGHTRTPASAPSAGVMRRS